MAHHEPQDERRQTHERFLLPLVVPAAIFLFAVLVIYGLSRIYLELNTWEFNEVGMATPLAIGIALLILIVSAFLASRPVSAGMLVMLGVLAAGGLTGGAIWAAVHDEGETERVVAPTETPPPDGTPADGDGGPVVSLDDDPDFAVTVQPESAPAGALTFTVNNDGTILHNLRVIKTDLAPDALPVDSGTFQVPEDEVDVVSSVDEFSAGESQTLEVMLEAGSYVLICNVAAHYESGMHAAFTAE